MTLLLGAPRRTNLCTNPTFEQVLTGWTLGTRVTDFARRGTTSLFRAAAAGNIHHQFDFAATAGQVYTLSGYVRGSGTVQLSLRDSAGTLVVASGQVALTNEWTRISVTGTASTGTQRFAIRSATAANVWLDDVLIEQSPVALAYFDGSFPLCLWNGGPHTSSSRRPVQGQARTNQHPNPSVATTEGWIAGGRFGTGGAGSYSLEAGAGAQGAGFLRKTWTTAPTSNIDTGVVVDRVGASVATLANHFTTTPGEVISVAGFLRASSAAKNGYCRIQWRDAANALLSPSNAVTSVLTPGEWTRVSHTATAPANAAAFLVLLDIATGGTLWAPGDTLDADGVIVERSAFGGFYFDGSSPGCSWSGSANASTSVMAAIPTWSRWDGVSAEPLTVSRWDGSLEQPISLEDVSVA